MNETEYDVADYGLTRLFHRISALEIEDYPEVFEGRDGEVDGVGARYAGRTISVDFVYQVNDIYDFYLLRDKINTLFSIKDPFYIIFKREPYKRWRVRRLSGFTLEPNPKAGVFTVEFKCVNLYAESLVYSTATKSWDIDRWGWDGSIDWDTPLQYEFNSNNFIVRNLGNVTIDPREHEIRIYITATASSYLKITNQTTGDVYQLNNALSPNDNLVLNGVESKLNSSSVFGKTNHKLLTLAPGPNEFLIEGGTIHRMDFEFRFLYK